MMIIAHPECVSSHSEKSNPSALERIWKEKPDLILVDLNMPDITGIDLTRCVRERYSKEDLPIVMVTTQDEIRDYEEAYAVGINDIMQKPFSEEQIGNVLKKFTGKPSPSYS